MMSSAVGDRVVRFLHLLLYKVHPLTTFFFYTIYLYQQINKLPSPEKEASLKTFLQSYKYRIQHWQKVEKRKEYVLLAFYFQVVLMATKYT